MERAKAEQIAAGILKSTYEMLVSRPEQKHRNIVTGIIRTSPAVERRTLVTTDRPEYLAGLWRDAGYTVTMTPVSEISGLE